MRNRRWINNTQPQTLQIAVILLYVSAGFTLLTAALGGLSALSVAIMAAEVAGGYGVANERKWGYGLAIAASVVPLVLLVRLAGNVVFGGLLLTFMLQIALVALLLHPQSRAYQRVWFK